MSLDVFQQVFTLSLFANLVNDQEGTQTTLQTTLQRAIINRLPTVNPDWQLVWGPVVWKNQPDDATTGPDNSWYIAYNPSVAFEDGSVHPTYVIAVAGTPPKSEYVWTKQNFAVNSVVDFNLWVANGITNPPVVVPPSQIVPGTPYIAKGTVNAVHLLLTKPAPEGAAGAGTILVDFVANLDLSDDTRVITTGHSLGGALSPSLALALVSSGLIPADGTLTYPSAGPSPGNRGLTELFTAVFPPRKLDSASAYQGWNLNLVNTLDIVPQAWAVQRVASPKQNLGNIPPIYGTPIILFVRGIATVFAIRALSSGALYFPLPSQYITGPTPPATPTSLKEFLQYAVLQHGQPYYDEVGVVPPALDESETRAPGIHRKTGDETLFDYPVIAEFEWARENPEEAKKEIDQVEGTEEGKALLAEQSD